MISLRRPSDAALRAFLAGQSGHDYTYEAVGGTAGEPPAGFAVNRTRVALGEGERAFAAAKAALRGWAQFRLGWVDARPHDAPIAPGTTVAVVARLLGGWWLNACRIVYVVDERGPVDRFGFAYGTLPAHVARGEERFLVEWDRALGTVRYDILAFSRPNLALARVGYPYLRRVQARFGRESSAAMIRATAGGA